eukprot:jgi/Chrzof1/124/Cz01g04070.t1
MELARKADREQRLSVIKDQADPRENINGHLSWFSTQQAEIQQSISELHTITSSNTDTSSSDQQQLNQQVDKLTGSIAGLEQGTSAAAYYLPPYDLRQCTASINDLRQQLEAMKVLLQPKRKFAFSKKVTRVKAGSQQSEADSTTAAAQPSSSATPAESSSQEAAGQPSISSYDLSLVQSGHGLMDLTGQLVVKTAAELSGREFVLINLTNCTIYLLGPMAALRIHQLNHCTVYTGPITGSAFLNGASDCTFMLAAYQVRVHHVHASQLYLRVRSRPIIESCDGLSIAPYHVDGLGLTATIVEAKLGEDNGLWAQVDDFGWVKATQSPHWCVLPDGQRTTPSLPSTFFGHSSS